jgi:hypothetical protein|nr:hypothetical protein [Rhodopirellula europaea]
MISGVYPHLTTYGVYSQRGGHYLDHHQECGIGAIVPWAGKLFMVNYAPHMPGGSEHKLYSVDADLSQPITIHPESVGGTPAGRMIHQESNQLLIAHYLIDSEGKVRVISPDDMPMRVTAITRHLTDPANKVCYIDMEGAIWEANVHTLAVKRLFAKPVPGWHSKGGYVSQGRLVVSNNGELSAGTYDDLLVGGKARTDEERGVLAEYDGKEWSIVERRQYTEVTGPAGIAGGSDGDAPIWAVGWDRRSLRLKLLDHGTWRTYLLPKAAYCNDASHGWYTEWPRIREITDGRWMMDMHGMFFDFPKTFSAANSAGIKPMGSHLRYVPDFCNWNGQLVLATDETSIQGNELAGQPQSNLWFGEYEDLKEWGPSTAYGGPWIDDVVEANSPSDPFLIAGFDRRLIHLTVDQAAGQTDSDVTFSLEVDRLGNGSWNKIDEVEVPTGGYVAHMLPQDLDAVWLRFTVDQDCVATAFLHQTTGQFLDGNAVDNQALFAGLADVEDVDVRGGLLYPAKRNRNLRMITRDERFFEFTKSNFQFIADSHDASLQSLLEVKPVFTVDDASVVLKHGGETLRLPKGNAAFDQPFAGGWPRDIREVESERNLANIHGTFYEVPLIKNGEPPHFRRMRPVASHTKQIADFCSWNGLLVITGLKQNAEEDGHVFADDRHHTALWFGGIDDLWKLGKPTGRGGPWLRTQVDAGVPSDAYLMTGYDKKSAVMSHSSSENVTFTLQIDIDGTGRWVDYRSFQVAPDKLLSFDFPVGFSACWVRAVSDRDTTATLQLTYQ